MRRIFAVSVLVSVFAFSCMLWSRQSPILQSTAAQPSSADHITVPQGTHVLLSLIHPISTKNAKPGDGVYLKTSFPVAENNEMAIPAGTYVQGEITSVKRAGRIHRAAEVRFRFTTLIFPSGYTVYIPGAVENVPAVQNAHVSDKEEQFIPIRKPAGTSGPWLGLLLKAPRLEALVPGVSKAWVSAAESALRWAPEYYCYPTARMCGCKKELQSR